MRPGTLRVIARERMPIQDVRARLLDVCLDNDGPFIDVNPFLRMPPRSQKPECSIVGFFNEFPYFVIPAKSASAICWR